MRTTLLLSLLLLLAGVCTAQQDVDVEGLREILHRLVTNGHSVTSESLAPIFASFTGIERSLLARFIHQLESAAGAEDLLLTDKIADLASFKDLLFNLQSLGVSVHPAVAEALLSAMDDPAKRTLQPYIAQWKQANAVSLTDSLRGSIDSAIAAISEVLEDSVGSVQERIRARLTSLPTGMARSMLTGIDEILERERLRRGSSGEFRYKVQQPGEGQTLSTNEIQADIDQVDKVLNREIVQFLSTSMLRLSKPQLIEQLDILKRKVFDSSKLPDIFEAILRNLK